MKALIVFESAFGNTRRLAEAIADGLRSAGAEPHVIPACEAPGTATCDLLVLGAPTHFRGMPSPRSREQAVARGASEVPRTGLREWLTTADLSSVPRVAIFQTAVDSRWAGSAARAVRRAVGRRGAERRSFIVSGKAPVLNDGEKESARAWGVALAGDR
ncbi:flavodoxin family protein [Propionibacterium australiense]|uniref:Flavodoxin-like domain profile n=1 Tax=Propionibacterium australiense TaxID=119981 RepID=A0A383S578_9ACTN|nr:flavodoxin domain-containing protein [Propionibacterium australiense]RLP07078.1 flavodoxin family protein [Propionibacterium australiense]SYZ33160.1 Flavodoxin-like domain profile [Propionibacterium australiense]VEH89176.1 Flavodoxin [Propionibacterium australiense]